jgi:[ribosomal protein S5]-alanine N-acetyltransferase
MRSVSIETFETSRLRAERIRAADLEEMRRLHRDERVMATLGGVLSDAETRAWLERNLERWERDGFGRWVFRDRADGGFVGRGGLRRFELEGRDEVELSYAVAAERWSLGFGTEIARAVVTVGAERLGLRDVIAFTLPTNVASRRVMEKAGFAYERDIVHAGLPHVLYRRRAG